MKSKDVPAQHGYLRSQSLFYEVARLNCLYYFCTMQTITLRVLLQYFAHYHCAPLYMYSD
jgi:hypothetical protein